MEKNALQVYVQVKQKFKLYLTLSFFGQVPPTPNQKQHLDLISIHFC